MRVKQSVHCPKCAFIIRWLIYSSFTTDEHTFTIHQVIIHGCQITTSSKNWDVSITQIFVILTVPYR